MPRFPARRMTQITVRSLRLMAFIVCGGCGPWKPVEQHENSRQSAHFRADEYFRGTVHYYTMTSRAYSWLSNIVTQFLWQSPHFANYVTYGNKHLSYNYCKYDKILIKKMSAWLLVNCLLSMSQTVVKIL